MPAGKRSLTFEVFAQSMEGTLADDEVKEIQQWIIQALESEVGGTLRE